MIQKSRINRAQLTALLLPGLAVFGMFTVYPIVRLFWMSLCDMSFSSMLTQPFAGLMNYREVFRDGTFWTVFVNSVVYTLVTVPGQMAIGLFVAVLLNGIKRFSVTFRVINYLPVVTSWVIASLVFRYIFNTEGLLNYFLWKVLGITSGNIRWLDTRWSGLTVAMILGIWKGIGWNMVIFLAALQQVPKDRLRRVEEVCLRDAAGHQGHDPVCADRVDHRRLQRVYVHQDDHWRQARAPDGHAADMDVLQGVQHGPVWLRGCAELRDGAVAGAVGHRAVPHDAEPRRIRG